MPILPPTEIAAYRQAGLAWTVAELRLPPRGPDRLAAASRTGDLAAAERLATRPSRVYEPNAVPYLGFPRLASLKELAKHFRDRAEARAARRDAEGAIRDLTTIRRLAERAMDEPNTISLLVGYAVEGIGEASVRRIAAESTDERLLARLATFSLTRPKLSLARAMQGEAFQGLSMIRSLGPKSEPVLRTHVRVWTRAAPMVAGTLSPADSKRRWAELERDYAATKDENVRQLAHTYSFYPPVANIERLYADRNRITRAYVAALFTRERTGELPDRIPGVNYHRQGAGFVIGSANPNSRAVYPPEGTR